MLYHCLFPALAPLLLVPGTSGAPVVTVLAKETVVRKKTTAELAFDLPDLPAGKQVRLGLAARVNYSCSCANNPAMTATVNGRSVVGDDLLNKPLEYRNKNGRDASWATPRGSSWLLFSWPDFSVDAVRACPSPYAIPDADPFEFVWDITAAVKPGRNLVAITHGEITSEDHYLVLRDIRIEVGEPVASQAQPPVLPPPAGEVPEFIPSGPRPVAMLVQLAAGGDLRITLGTRTLDLKSRTSEPGGAWAETSAGDHVTASPAVPAAVTWPRRGYTVRRMVSVRPDHVHVADTVTNTTTELIGVRYETWLVLSTPPTEILLGGRPHYARYQNEGGGTNPTALARWPDLAVGMAAENDLFRVHVKEFATAESMGLADHELGLAPGANHTLEWSLYLLPGGDYWDFINAVRRNWGCNFTIPGLHLFVPWSDGARSDEYYRDWVTRRSARLVTPFDAMFDTGTAAMGTAIPQARAFCERTTAWIRQLHQAAPGVEALFYLNCTLCTEPDAPQKYADSRLLDANGTQLTMPAGGPKGVTMAPLFVSTLDNSYGRAMMTVAKWIITDLGADGLYHDVLCSADYGIRAYGVPWDGCTVSIDPQTHAVTGKASMVALLQLPWHQALVAWLRANGKRIIGNCPVETRTMLGLQIPVFVETGFSYSCAIQTHLGSPWAYGNYPARDPARGTIYNAAYNLRRLLGYGSILAQPSWSDEPNGLTFLHLLFPFTPIEIRPGVLIGVERIITCRSGRFGWADASTAETHVFDGDGERVETPHVTALRAGDCVLTEVRLPSDHFAILARRQAVPSP